MSTVRRKNANNRQSLRACGNGRVDKSQRRVRIYAHYIRGASKVLRIQRLNGKLPRNHGTQERQLSARPQSRVQQVGDFGKNRGRNQDLLFGPLPPRNYAAMPGIIPIYQRVKCTGIRENGQMCGSCQSNSSTRSDPSDSPLAN